MHAFSGVPLKKPGTFFLFIRKMLKTLEDVTDSGSHICALDKG
jgi:hypothetical protein